MTFFSREPVRKLPHFKCLMTENLVESDDIFRKQSFLITMCFRIWANVFYIFVSYLSCYKAKNKY